MMLVDNKFFKKLMPMLCGEVEAQRMLVQFCVLSGCDFIESLPRIGIMVLNRVKIRTNYE